MTENRLARETSPYLLQHAHNPVDWYPWGEEAFARARAEDKPILLSVGYSACHWCHVMERESFENPEIAGIMNEGFVSVKVDREERPDVDHIYMQAVQSMTGQGGWPMTVFLTPDGTPFYGGTYFPPQDRHGLPGFPKLLAAIGDAWRSRRGEVEQSARELTASLNQTERLRRASTPLGEEILFSAFQGVSWAGGAPRASLMPAQSSLPTCWVSSVPPGRRTRAISAALSRPCRLSTTSTEPVSIGSVSSGA